MHLLVVLKCSRPYSAITWCSGSSIRMYNICLVNAINYLEAAFAIITCLEKKHLLLRIVCLKSDSYSSRNTPKPYNPNFTRDSPEKLALLDVFMYL